MPPSQRDVSYPHVRNFCTLVTASLILVILAAVPTAGADPERDYIVGFRELPNDRSEYGGGKVREVNEELRSFQVRAGSSQGLEQRAAHDPNVEYVEEDALLFSTLWTPDDSFFAKYQYDLHASTTNMQAAWAKTRGSTDVKVCVIDTGQYRAHSDLRTVAWADWKDFVQGKPSAYDDHGHGTHVTGTIGAVLNNARGIAGIAMVSIAGAKVINSDGYGSVSALSNAIIWCTKIGAHIINISLGGGYSSTLANAVRYASNNGVLVVAAAGNRGACDGTCVVYPARLPQALAVACTDQYNRRCSFSSEGPEVDVAAPGLSILSTAIPTCGSTSCYVRKSGTSMSTPHVVGLAALVKSEHFHYDATEIRNAILGSAKDLGASGHDRIFGAGLIQGTAVR